MEQYTTSRAQRFPLLRGLQRCRKQQHDATHDRSATDDHPKGWSWLFVHSSAAGMPRAGMVVLGTPFATSLVVCSYPPERM